MATHSSTLAWKNPWMEEPGKAAVPGVAKSQARLSDFTLFIRHFSKTNFISRSQKMYILKFII